jgi:hypothetical protein
MVNSRMSGSTTLGVAVATVDERQVRGGEVAANQWPWLGVMLNVRAYLTAHRFAPASRSVIIGRKRSSLVQSDDAGEVGRGRHHDVGLDPELLRADERYDRPFKTDHAADEGVHEDEQ